MPWLSKVVIAHSYKIGESHPTLSAAHLRKCSLDARHVVMVPLLILVRPKLTVELMTLHSTHYCRLKPAGRTSGYSAAEHEAEDGGILPSPPYPKRGTKGAFVLETKTLRERTTAVI